MSRYLPPGARIRINNTNTAEASLTAPPAPEVIPEPVASIPTQEAVEVPVPVVEEVEEAIEVSQVVEPEPEILPPLPEEETPPVVLMESPVEVEVVEALPSPEPAPVNVVVEEPVQGEPVVEEAPEAETQWKKTMNKSELLAFLADPSFTMENTKNEIIAALEAQDAQAE